VVRINLHKNWGAIQALSHVGSAAQAYDSIIPKSELRLLKAV
jgi:hypothetical protein